MMVDDAAAWAKRVARNMVDTMDVGAGRVAQEVALCRVRARRGVLEELLLVTVTEEIALRKGTSGLACLSFQSAGVEEGMS